MTQKQFRQIFECNPIDTEEGTVQEIYGTHQLYEGDMPIGECAVSLDYKPAAGDRPVSITGNYNVYDYPVDGEEDFETIYRILVSGTERLALNMTAAGFDEELARQHLNQLESEATIDQLLTSLRTLQYHNGMSQYGQDTLCLIREALTPPEAYQDRNCRRPDYGDFNIGF
jgi:hypothetical protein